LLGVCSHDPAGNVTNDRSSNEVDNEVHICFPF
jgi:hypothetical protein